MIFLSLFLTSLLFNKFFLSKIKFKLNGCSLFYFQFTVNPLQGFFNYFVYRDAFKASKPYKTRQPRLSQPNPNAREIIHQMMDKEPLNPKKHEEKNIEYYKSFQKSYVSSKNTEMPPYKSRLLGESSTTT